jgi:hypothetical protein
MTPLVHCVDPFMGFNQIKHLCEVAHFIRVEDLIVRLRGDVIQDDGHSERFVCVSQGILGDCQRGEVHVNCILKVNDTSSILTHSFESSVDRKILRERESNIRKEDAQREEEDIQIGPDGHGINFLV